MTDSIRTLLTISFMALLAAPASAVTIDFEEFAHGDEVTSSQGVGITVVNKSDGPDKGVAFDTNEELTSDEDLQFLSPNISGGENGWASGNLAPDTDLGNILIIQEHDYSCSDGNCFDPDDEGSRPEAGSIAFDFTGLGTSFNQFSMDIVDVEESRTVEPGMIDFYLNDELVEQVFFSDFSAPEVVYGDNSANHLDVLNGISFDKVVVSLGGSGGIDNITAGTAVPEPTAALLFFAGMGVLRTGIRRR